MINFGNISKEKIDKLLEEMAKLNIKEEDLEEKFILSSGKGGQNVNKNSTCVYLKHIPTGIFVKCSKDRNQQKNRYFARKMLVEKLDLFYNGENSKKMKEIEKIKKQKRKRYKRNKEKNSNNLTQENINNT